MSRLPSGLLALALAALVCGAGCDEKKPSPTSDRQKTDAGQDKYVNADPKLTKAMKSATVSPSSSDDGPPPQGVFRPGEADKRHRAGDPTKLELVSEGAEPRLALAGAADASPDSARGASYGPVMLEIAIQLGPRVVLPTIDLSLTLGPAKPDDGGQDWLVGDVKRAVPSKEQAGQLPAESELEIASLEGTQIRVKITGDGRESDVQTRLGKAARQDFERVAENAAEALALATVPAPAKPVGVGAQWLAETRMPWSGVDVIAYRAFRVVSTDGHRARLSVQIKAYATSKATELQGVPKGGTLEEFEADAQGEMEAVAGEVIARRSQLQQRIVLVFADPSAPPPPAQPGKPGANVLTAQIQTTASLVRGDDLRSMAGKGDARRDPRRTLAP